jgi:hypothetical protein
MTHEQVGPVKRLGVIAIAAALAGCAHGLIGPLPAAEPGASATVTILRDPSAMSVGSVLASLDGTPVLALNEGESATLTLPTGARTFGATCSFCPRDTDSVVLTLEAGGRYYLRLTGSVDGPRILQLTREAAEPILRQTRPIHLERDK